MATKNETTETTKVKKFAKTTLIPCRSICTGVLYVEGPNSKNDYMWWDFGDIQDVQYQDLDAYVKRHATCVYKPQFIIEDDDYIAQNPDIKAVYDSMYTTSDLREILNLPVSQMKKAIMELPLGAKEAIRGLAPTMIENKKLDSIEKIRVLDEIFGTQLILTVAQI